MAADDNRRMNLSSTRDGAVALPELGVLRAAGADAAAFLHGQLTHDVMQLAPTQARLAGYCSAKGRLLATFVVWKASADELLLVCPQPLLSPTLKRLAMFVLRAKCRLSDASAEFELVGLAGPTAAVRTGDAAAWSRQDAAEGSLIRLPDSEGSARALLVRPRGAAPVNAPALSHAAWAWLAVRSGVPAIEAATVDRFVPQMLNFELLGGVDFRKGCYPGQEVVARSQYRGTIKRRMFLFETDGEARAGDEVFHDDDPGQPAGMVVNAAAAPESARASALVEIKLATLDGGTLHLGQATGPLLERAALPYAVPA